MTRYQTVGGQAFPQQLRGAVGLPVLHVLQRHREVWAPIPTWPFLAVEETRVETLLEQLGEFPVFAHGYLMQNLRPQEGAGRLMSALAGGGVDAGMSPDSKMIVEGVANPGANWFMGFNDPLEVGSHPFAALGTHYIYLDEEHSYQRKFAELIVVNGYSRPHSEHVSFDRLADLAHTFHSKFINGPRDQPRDLQELAVLLDAIFEENEKVLAAVGEHHRCAPRAPPFDYAAPTLTRYGRLTHDADRTPRIELVFALLHYEKALREFDQLKAVAQGDAETAFSHGVYCVVAVAACVEAIANKLVLQQTGAHPAPRDGRTPIEKINQAAAGLPHVDGQPFRPLVAGQETHDALDAVRKLRNAFMHAKEQAEDIDPLVLTAAVFTAVDEARCRHYLRNLRLAAAHVYEQLDSPVSSPIVTRENVDWLGGLEVP